jgi:hypothetical protein
MLAHRADYFVKSYFAAIGARTPYPDVEELFGIGHPFYNRWVFGAEAIEQAERCDGFISVKPFGCMASSSVSGGVQASARRHREQRTRSGMRTQMSRQSSKRGGGEAIRSPFGSDA